MNRRLEMNRFINSLSEKDVVLFAKDIISELIVRDTFGALSIANVVKYGDVNDIRQELLRIANNGE